MSQDAVDYWAPDGTVPTVDNVTVSELLRKTAHEYLTSEGYPLGTECLYVFVEAKPGVEGIGRRTICGLTPLQVYTKLCEFLADPRAYRDSRGRSELG